MPATLDKHHDIIREGIKYPSGTWTGEIWYVAGGMRGYDQSNFVNFDKGRDGLLGEGVAVISPADLDRIQKIPNDGTDHGIYHDVMHLDILVLLGYVDGIYFLDRWWKSEGAVTEYIVGRALNLKMRFQNENGPKNITILIQEKDFTRCL